MTDERAFLTAILEQPDDDVRKLAYADWLEEQGDPRAEYLRLMVKLRRERQGNRELLQRHRELSDALAALHTEEQAASAAHPPVVPRNRDRYRRIRLESQLRQSSQQMQQIPTRLQELAATLDPNWMAVVGDPTVEGCGRRNGERWELRFEFVCDQTWADLKPTEHHQVRGCDRCRQSVQYCDNIADAREHSQQGHCIAVDLGIIRRKGDLTPPRSYVMVGQPSRESLRRECERDIDPVSQARLNARRAVHKPRKRQR